MKKIKCTRKDKIMFNHRFSKAIKKTILQYTVVAIILEIIPTKIDLLTKIHANLLINTKKVSYIRLQVTRHETRLTAKDFLNCSHGMRNI